MEKNGGKKNDRVRKAKGEIVMGRRNEGEMVDNIRTECERERNIAKKKESLHFIKMTAIIKQIMCCLQYAMALFWVYIVCSDQ